MSQSSEPSLGSTEEGIFEKILNQIETGSEEEMNPDSTWIKLGKGEKSPKFVEFVRNVLATGRKFEVERKELLGLDTLDNLIFRKDGGVHLERIIKPRDTYPKWTRPKSALSRFGCDYLNEIFDSYPPAGSQISFWVLEDNPCLIRYSTKEGQVFIVLAQRRDWW